MDQGTRNDIAAATAAHHELGRDYDNAIAEGLVDRIGAEIDKRIDARMSTGPAGSRPAAQSWPSGKAPALFLAAGIGAGLTGLVGFIGEHGSKHALAAVLVVWAILAVAGLGAAVAIRYRNMSAALRADSTHGRSGSLPR